MPVAQWFVDESGHLCDHMIRWPTEIQKTQPSNLPHHRSVLILAGFWQQPMDAADNELAEFYKAMIILGHRPSKTVQPCVAHVSGGRVDEVRTCSVFVRLGGF